MSCWLSLLADPARLDRPGQCLEIGVGREVGQIVSLLAGRAPLADKPNLFAWHVRHANALKSKVRSCVRRALRGMHDPGRPAVEPGPGLLELARKLQQARFVAEPADEVHAEREAVGGPAQRNAHRRRPGQVGELRERYVLQSVASDLIDHAVERAEPAREAKEAGAVENVEQRLLRRWWIALAVADRRMRDRRRQQHVVPLVEPAERAGEVVPLQELRCQRSGRQRAAKSSE